MRVYIDIDLTENIVLPIQIRPGLAPNGRQLRIEGTKDITIDILLTHQQCQELCALLTKEEE